MGSGFEMMKMAVKKHNDRGVRQLFDERLLVLEQYEQCAVEILMNDWRVYQWFCRCDGLPVAFRHVDFSQRMRRTTPGRNHYPAHVTATDTGCDEVLRDHET